MGGFYIGRVKMYQLHDLDFEKAEQISVQQKEEILILHDQLWISDSQYVQATDLDQILMDEYYYVCTDYCVVKGKTSVYKGIIVVAKKAKLIEYLARIIQLNEVRSLFIIAKNQHNMLLRLDDEGGLMLSVMNRSSIA